MEDERTGRPDQGDGPGGQDGTGGPAIDVPPQVFDFLQQQKILTLATATPAGLPHAATLVYANDGLTIYFWTRPETVTARHVDQNPAVAFTISQYTEDWTQTRGVQGSGECRVLLNPGEIQRVVQLFKEKFPAITQTRTAGLSCFGITPSELQFIDNTSRAGERAGQGLVGEYRRSLVYSVFRQLPQQEVETVAGHLDTVQFDAGEVIVRQGAPADKFFIIIDGEVDVIREDDGTPRKVATLRRGQFFGEMAILRDMPRTATVQASTPSTLLTMDRDAFRGLVAQSLGTTQDFDRIIHQRLQELGAAPPQSGA